MHPEFKRLIIFGFIADTKANRDNYLDVIKSERAQSSSEPSWAVNYASDIIEGRFEEAEPVILKEPHWAYLYAANVLHARWSAAEKVILESGDIGVTWDYFKDVVKSRWVEAEPILFKKEKIKQKYFEYLQWLENPEGLFVGPVL